MIVGSFLIGSGTATGALVGVVASLLAAPVVAAFGQQPPSTTAALVMAGVALDGLGLVAGRPAPLSVGRQVPRQWGWILPAPVTAGLYGSRLGVGPLTMLSTWTWWSFTVAAALRGPATGALVGGAFGLVRLITTAWVSLAASGAGHARTFGLLRAERRRGWATVTAATTATALLSLALTACGTAEPAADRSVLVPTTTGRPVPTASAESQTGSESRAESESRTESGSEPRPGPGPGPPADLITPAELEDVVRPSTPTTPDTSTPAAGPAAVAVADPAGAPASLADSLPTAIAGFDPIDEAGADRPLDIDAAAAIQPDPTEEIALLETRGYRDGWLRAFRNEANDVAVASVYRFENPAEAEFYLEDGLITIGGYGGSFFDIPQLPGVRGFVQEISTSDGESTEDLVSLGASFHRGDRWYLLYLLGSPATVTPELLVPAVTAQYRTAGGQPDLQPTPSPSPSRR